MFDTEIKDSIGYTYKYDDGLEKILDTIVNHSKLGKKLIFIGNGGSAGIASHTAIDYSKNGGVRSICFNEGALLTCLSNDYGYERVFEKAIEIYADQGDILIAISSSGESKNILNAVELAKEKKCIVITLSGFSYNNNLRRVGDFNIYVPSSKYGYVELAHQIILHSLVDFL